MMQVYSGAEDYQHACALAWYLVSLITRGPSILSIFFIKRKNLLSKMLFLSNKVEPGIWEAYKKETLVSNLMNYISSPFMKIQSC